MILTPVAQSYEPYRSHDKHGWGLSWWLASEICERFYASHGIVPQVIIHEGLGYYGIQFDPIPCSINGSKSPTLGRLTVDGDVENWITGFPGDHGLALRSSTKEGEPLSVLLSKAIQHLNFPTYPQQSHLHCRHKRWGSSYVLMFQLAAILALKHEDNLEIWNHDCCTGRMAKEYDNKIGQNEHLGHFLLINQDRRILLAGDGRMLFPKEANLWEQYMSGLGVDELIEILEEALSL